MGLLLLHHPDEHVFVHFGHVLGVVLKQGLHQPDGGFHPVLLHFTGVEGGGAVVGLQKRLFFPDFSQLDSLDAVHQHPGDAVLGLKHLLDFRQDAVLIKVVGGGVFGHNIPLGHQQDAPPVLHGVIQRLQALLPPHIKVGQGTFKHHNAPHGQNRQQSLAGPNCFTHTIIPFHFRTLPYPSLGRLQLIILEYSTQCKPPPQGNPGCAGKKRGKFPPVLPAPARRLQHPYHSTAAGGLYDHSVKVSAVFSIFCFRRPKPAHLSRRRQKNPAAGGIFPLPDPAKSRN